MSGFVCLQGGAEFGDDCRAMDAEVVRRAHASRPGPVVVVALAPAPGYEHDTTIAEAHDYYSSLGVGSGEVLGAPDARDEPAAARELVGGASLVVLPGGSPGGLLAALRDSGLDDVLVDVIAAGGAVSGSSAGAMVQCEWTFVRVAGGVELRPGLGIVPRALVLPHYDGDQRWLAEVRDDLDLAVTVLALPEAAGIVVDGPGFIAGTAVGSASVELLGARTETLRPGARVELRGRRPQADTDR